MTSNHSPVEHAATVLREAVSAGQLGRDTSSAIFHSLSRLEERLAEMHNCFPPGTLHAIAAKANPLVEVIKVAVASGAGIEAASMEEVHVGLAAGCPTQRIVYDSPVKTMADLEESLSMGIHVNADSLEEILRIAEIRKRRQSSSNTGLRINPLVGPGAISTTSVSERTSKFGVPIDEGHKSVLGTFQEHPWLNCLHVHAGSQGFSLRALAGAVARVDGLRRQINEAVGSNQVSILDIGGGLPVDYDGNDEAASISDYAQILREMAPHMFSEDVRIITEFGRIVHADSAWAATRVEYVKSAGQCRTAIVHLGADFLMRPVYQPQHWRHRLIALDRDGHIKSGPPRPWNIAGPLCFAGDFIARDIMLPDLQPEDLILIMDVGAYTLSMWSRHCSRGIPVVIGYRGQSEPDFSLLRRGETPQDVASFWSSHRA